MFATWLQRHFRAVVIDLDVLDQARCAPGRCASSSVIAWNVATHFCMRCAGILLEILKHAISPYGTRR